MTKGRLEAFSDGVIAVIITIMVLELKTPSGASLAALRPLIPVFSAYVLSFIFVGIYWNNHHHLLHATGHIDGRILWANLHLLFWLSLTPVATSWMGANHDEALPTAAYGVVLLLAGAAYRILVSAIIARNGPESAVARAVGGDVKGLGSLALYLAAIGLSFVRPWIAQALYLVVAAIWLVPDKRIERTMARRES